MKGAWQIQKNFTLGLVLILLAGLAYYQFAYKPAKEVELAKQKVEQEKADKIESKSASKEKSFLDNPLVQSAGRTAATMITRSLLGVLGFGGRSRR